MSELDPQVLAAVTAAVVAAAMVVLGRKTRLLEGREPKRCASCGRRLDSVRGCTHCS